MSLRKKIHEEVPTTDLVLRVPLTEEGTVRLRAMANRVGCPPRQLVQQGIDWVADLADQSPGQAFERLRESSPLCREVRPGREASSEGKSGSEKKGCPFAVALRPARVAGLKEAALTIATTARENPESPSLWQEGSPTQSAVESEDIPLKPGGQ